MKLIKKLYIFVVICLFFSCSREKIKLPNPTELDSIKIIKINVSENTKKEISNIKNSKEIKAFIKEISNAIKTKDESVQDHPINVDTYFKVMFNHKISKENPSVMYIYNSKKYMYKDYIYFEQPYKGIFKIKDKDLKLIKKLSNIKK